MSMEKQIGPLMQMIEDYAQIVFLCGAEIIWDSSYDMQKVVEENRKRLTAIVEKIERVLQMVNNLKIIQTFQGIDFTDDDDMLECSRAKVLVGEILKMSELEDCNV